MYNSMYFYGTTVFCHHHSLPKLLYKVLSLTHSHTIEWLLPFQVLPIQLGAIWGSVSLAQRHNNKLVGSGI